MHRKCGGIGYVFRKHHISRILLKFRLKVAEVTEEKVATIKITDIQYMTD